ncbi:DUF2332 domain-containing protein [Qipengyuania sediminis]|uniref:DUF2332 domain-containing protein n=1 Tax=Qipengyuania sediminis TaxID=1532023 RepID=UPI001059E326|nr:DUF2332 domain-containing protein [Qipengyuania sediminis]
MALVGARYEAIDPQAKGLDAVRTAFANQVAYCRDNGAPVTALVCDALSGLLDGRRGGAVMARIQSWEGAPLADALPLRIAGGLHALHLAGADRALAPIYAGEMPADAHERLAAAIERHETRLLPWLDGPPQTNEAGRSWGFAAAMLWLGAQGCPRRFALYELGSSAGINLVMARYRFDLGGVEVGPDAAAMSLAPDWRGAPPPAGGFTIQEARGCDVAPVDLTDPEQALRLRAYVWPEQTARFARLDAAIAEARRAPPAIARQSAGDFVREVLACPPKAGVTRLIAHSVVWQYIPAEERASITAAIEAAGTEATAETPLAWAMLEANRDTHRHELRVRYWPDGGDWHRLATAHPHGAWVEWAG